MSKALNRMGRDEMGDCDGGAEAAADCAAAEDTESDTPPWLTGADAQARVARAAKKIFASGQTHAVAAIRE
jgi:hypothetical protein